MNAETVISKHNQSTNNRSVGSEENVQERNVSSHSPSVKSQDVGELSSHDASVKSHDLQRDASPGGLGVSVGSRDASQSMLPSSGDKTQDSHTNSYQSDHTDSRRSDDSLRPWENPPGNSLRHWEDPPGNNLRPWEGNPPGNTLLVDPQQYQGLGSYELRLRVREQEELQRMIDRQKERVRQREEEERKLREMIQRELEEEALARKNMGRSPIDQLYVARGTNSSSNREFGTPERHTPEITRSTSRTKSHDHRTESGYYDSSGVSGATRYDQRQSSGVRRDIAHETERTMSNRYVSGYSKDASSERYSDRRSPYLVANGHEKTKGSSGRSSFMRDTGVASHRNSDYPYQEEFQPLPPEQVSTSGWTVKLFRNIY